MKRLQDPALAIAYLNEALIDEDQRVFLLALKNVLEAQGGKDDKLGSKSEINNKADASW